LNIVDLFNNNLIFSIASIIIDWMKEPNLIQENLLIIGRTDRRIYYISSDNLVNLLNNNNDF